MRPWLFLALALPFGANAQSVDLTCTDDAQAVPGDVGAIVPVTCPPGCKKGKVYGTDVYSEASSVCMAAAHMGATGPLIVTMAPGQASYVGSKRNGVSSKKAGSSPRSFGVAAVPEVIHAGLVAPVAAPTPGVVPVSATAATLGPECTALAACCTEIPPEQGGSGCSYAASVGMETVCKDTRDALRTALTSSGQTLPATCQ